MRPATGDHGGSRSSYRLLWTFKTVIHMAGQTFNETGIDKGVGALVLGMAIIGFLLLLIIGMDGARKNAERASSDLLTSPPKSSVPVNDLAE